MRRFRNVLKPALAAATLSWGAVTALAGTLTVTSPNDDDFLGSRNNLNFIIRGARVQVEVVAIITSTTDATNSIRLSERFVPNRDGEVISSLALNFADSTPEGTYRIRVEVNEPGNTYTPVTRTVTIDVRKPEFIEVQPVTNAFVRGVTRIRGRIQEPFIDNWRVRVNGQDIPNNSGRTTTFDVPWDTSSIRLDGRQQISITVDDRARNQIIRNLEVTVDRVPPNISILAPAGGANLRRGADIPVVIDVRDQFSGSVAATGIDVIVRTVDGRYVQRVARRSARASGNTLSWTGVIGWSNRLPDRFKIVVTAVDRAGNVAATQEVLIDIGRRR